MSMRTLVVATALALAPAANAAVPDARVKLLPYENDQVVPLAIAPGYAAVVELAADEVIENVVVGNSAAWQVTANSSSDRIIVKPLADASPTNMIVITDARRYVFLLQPFGGGEASVFVLRFTYADKPAQAARATAAATYRLTGTKALFPAAMQDDGTRTTITWAERAALPAVFAIGAGGKEAIVNGRMIGSDYVIEGTSKKYVFRLGDAVATASRKPVRAPK
jgi:type IV secretion system protein VirB9